MVANKADTFQCAACETARPGHEDKVSKSETESSSTDAKSSIGKTGFAFGGATSSTFTSAEEKSTTGSNFGKKHGETSSTTATGGFAFGDKIKVPLFGKSESSTENRHL